MIKDKRVYDTLRNYGKSYPYDVVHNVWIQLERNPAEICVPASMYIKTALRREMIRLRMEERPIRVHSAYSRLYYFDASYERLSYRKLGATKKDFERVNKARMAFDCKLLSDVPSSEVPVTYDNLDDLELHELIEKLPLKQRMMLDLYFWADWNTLDIAELFGCTRQRVHQVMQNALSKLRWYYDTTGIPESDRRNQPQLSNRRGKANDPRLRKAVS